MERARGGEGKRDRRERGGIERGRERWGERERETREGDTERDGGWGGGG